MAMVATTDTYFGREIANTGAAELLEIIGEKKILVGSALGLTPCVTLGTDSCEATRRRF